MTESELLDELKNGQKHFHRVCVEQGTFIGYDLSDVTFEESLLSVDFSGSNFNNAKFIDSNLKICNFSNCHFFNAVLDGNLLDGVKFTGAEIRGITFKNNTYHSIVLTHSHLEEMIL
jgi:uncharacterized protein YjbI with pentapeptide repeats